VDDDDQLLTAVVGEAARLLDSDGGMIYMLNESGDELHFAYDAGVIDPEAHRMLRDLTLLPGSGIFGSALARRELFWTNDYQNDRSFVHHPVADEVAAKGNMRSMAAAPMFANDQPLGVLGAFSSRTNAFSEQQLALLRALADHAGGAIANRRLLAELRDSEELLRVQTAELERSLEAQRAIDEISRRIVDYADSAEVLQQVVDVAAQLLGSDGAHLTLIDDDGRTLIPMVMAGLTEPAVRGWLRSQRFPIGGGINGLAAATGEVVWTEDYRHDPRIPHEPDDDSALRLGLGAAIVAPLRAPGGEIAGTLAITYREPRSIDEGDVALLDELSRQASIAASNARLYAELRERTAAQTRVVEAQRALSGIAVQIASIRDPQIALQRTVDEAVRLLRGDVAMINPLAEDGLRLRRPIAIAPAGEPFPEVTYDPGVGMSGLAIAERRVVRTDDYVRDPRLTHSGALDGYVGGRGIHSVITAPLVGGHELIGTVSVLSERRSAFDDDDAQLLGALAAQAATAIVNTRLYEQLGRSEARYRHLVEHSPDLVWEADGEGMLTYLGETLQRLTGFTPQELHGRHWTSLLAADSLEAAEAAWREMAEQPDSELQVRVRAVTSTGGVMAAEINMVGTITDGRFDGAHGSLRDISERERLEHDLRLRSVELAANEERAKLARELHDSVTQALFSMGLTLRTYEMLAERDPEAARAKLAELRQLQADALAEMRTLIFELRPHGLETDGLEQALRNHAAAVAGRTGLAIAVDVRLDERLDPDTEEALYRIAQEALHNVVKHANAESAHVRMAATESEVRLSVEDDGSGFDPAAASAGKLGLVGMRQRAEQLRGRLTVARRPGGGTQVSVVVPRGVGQAAGAAATDGPAGSA